VKLSTTRKNVLNAKEIMHLYIKKSLKMVVLLRNIFVKSTMITLKNTVLISWLLIMEMKRNSKDVRNVLKIIISRMSFVFQKIVLILLQIL